MPVSYAEQATLTCPQCGHEFTADIWLIVHAAERPDLIERARDGTLHRITCPRCGHTMGDVDAPLLIFTPPDMGTNRPPLLFSPAQQTTAEQDREHAAGLLARLRDALGDAWQDEWLEQAQVVPREHLSQILSGKTVGAQHAAPDESHVQAAIQARKALNDLAPEERARAIIEALLEEKPMALQADDLDDTLFHVLEALQAECESDSERAHRLTILRQQLAEARNA